MICSSESLVVRRGMLARVCSAAEYRVYEEEVAVEVDQSIVAVGGG